MWLGDLTCLAMTIAVDLGRKANKQTNPLPQRSESNNIGDWLIQSKKDGKDQESIQSSTTPDPGYQWKSNKLTVRHHKRELKGQDNLQMHFSSASATVLSKNTEPR